MSVALRSHLPGGCRDRAAEGRLRSVGDASSPAGAGLLFAGTVLVMLLGCINYNLGLGYVLMFLMSGIGIVSIPHLRNLLGSSSRVGVQTSFCR
jgi:hypothetical protein